MNPSNNRLNSSSRIGSTGGGITFESYPIKSNFKSRPISTAWHSEYPLFAVSTSNGVVSCYNEEGDRQDEINLSRSCACTIVTWHPTERILCTGWKDGDIHVYNNVDHSHKQVSQGSGDVSHIGNTITAMKWTPDGKRMMTADSGGIIGVWELNNRGRIVLIAFHNTGKRVTQLTNDQITFKKMDSTRNGESGNTSGGGTGGGTSGADTSMIDVDSWMFFFTGDDGLLYMVDDSDKYKQTTIDMKAPVVALLYHERKSSLISITVDSFLVISDISPDLRVNQRSRTKINLSSKETSDTTTSIPSNIKKQSIQVLWVGKDLLATISNERHVRVWNLEADDHCILSHSKINEPLSCFAFNSTKRVLAASTSSGSLFFWQYVGNTTTVNPSQSNHSTTVVEKSGSTESTVDEWESYADYQSESAVTGITWGPGEEVLSVSYEDTVSILHECILKKKMRGRLIVIQNSVESVSIIDQHMTKESSGGAEAEGKTVSEAAVKQVRCKIKIRQLDFTDNYLAVSSGRTIELYEMREGVIRNKASIDQYSQCIALHEEGVFVGVGSRIEIYNFSGTKKQTINFSESEGIPTHIDIQGDFIAVGTKNNKVKLLQASGREAKQVSADKKVFSDDSNAGDVKRKVISSVRVNCNGTKIAVLSRIVQNYGIQEPSTAIHIYDLEQDKIDTYDFAQTRKYPTALFWDQIEPKLFAVEAKSFGDADSSIAHGDLLPIGTISTCTLFATPDNGILLQDSFPLDRNFSALVGISVPSLYFSVRDNRENRDGGAERRVIVSSKKADDSPSGLSTPSTPASSRLTAANLIERRALRDFEGINIRDNKTRDALLLFSYYLTIDNMEEAYKSVKMIKDASVWSNMAQMCVKTKKMDVAEICLGNMLDATAARALREARETEPEIEAQIATLAIYLGLIPQAEQLYISCKRFDLLNKMYQSVGQWDKALKIVETHDRINLKTTHYQYAQYLESMGDYNGAIVHYEISNNHAYEVPRMLFDSNQLNELERYIASKVQQDDMAMENGTYNKPVPSNPHLSNSKDDTTQLINWWAQYCEGNSNFEEAIQYYTKSNDILSQVRLYCFSGNLKKAADIVKRSGDKAASYHLARQLEIGKRYDYAIKFYKQADAYHHAIRLAKEQDLPLEVMNLALQSTPKVMLDAAQYFEQSGMVDKAVMLYQKAGRVSLAIDLCFRSQLFDVLSDLADELSNESMDSSVRIETPADAQMLERCGDFFVQHEKFERAVHMYTKARQYVKALELCATKNVQLTDELAESLTPPKPDDNSSVEYKKRRVAILKKIAKLAAQQGNFKTASKKYVQSGDKMKAMRVLIKSGDTERIIFFANVSRQRELYILAANYLQNLDWQKDSDTLKQIISLYTKAKAWQNLSNFYEVCSQMEIDEFRNYEKALDALKDSLKYLTKEQKQSQANGASPSVLSDLSERVSELKNRIYLVEKFIQARALSNSTGTQSASGDIISLCNELLREPNIQSAIRVGDIYALLVEWHWTRKKDAAGAYKMIRKMLDEEIELHYYLEQSTVQDICATASMPMVEWGFEQEADGQQEEEIDEEVDEDY